MNANNIITLKNISKVFREPGKKNLLALRDINLEIKNGEFFVIVGPSGSGKSTLLRVISGLEKKYDGQLLWLPGVKKEDISFVFQNFAIMPWLTVAENIALGLQARETPPEEEKKIVAAEVKRLGLTKFENSYPRELSGGMRQRVGIARALATSPRVIFMDEPFSELDSFTAEELRRDLLQIWIEKKMTIVMVTHVISEAIELADRVAVLTARPATIEKIFPVTPGRPRKKRSPEFFAMEDKIRKAIRP